MLDGILGVAFLFQVGFAVGVAYLAVWVASMLISDETAEIQAPTLNNYPIQTGMKGGPIIKVYGTERVAGNVIYLGKSRSYAVAEGNDVWTTRYRRTFLVAICEGPAVVLRMWQGKTERSLSRFGFTWFSGDNNTGIRALTGLDGGDWPNLCCAWFEDYYLGFSNKIPNFTFEVSSGTGLEGKTFIYDLAGLQAMNDDLTADYVLMNDIDANPTSGWNGGDGFIPIGTGAAEFKGTLDGRNHTVDGLYVDRGALSYAGLFGYLGDATVAAQNGHVSNVKLTDCDISGNGVTGMLCGAVGEASTVTDCYAEGIVYTTGHSNGGLVGVANADSIFTRCGAVGSVTIYPTNDRSHTGGLVGITGGSIALTDCYARVIVSGGVTGGVNTGSLIGNEGTNNVLTNCYAAASIQYANSEYTYIYDTRPVGYQGGGVIGLWTAGGTYTSCYWDTEEGASVYPDAAKFDSAYNHERQTHDISADPTAGHFHITHNAITTGEIAWDDNEATVQAVCNAAFGAGEFDIEFNVSDIWKNGHYLKVMFYGSIYGQSPQADLTFDLTAMVPGGMTVNSTDDVTGVVPLSDAEITGKTTVQMQTEATFIGWDFDEVWYMGGSGYPDLRNQLLSGYDMNPADIIRDIIEDTRYGAGRTTVIDDTSLDASGVTWDAMNFRLSLKLDSQKPWLDWVDYVLAHVGGARFKSEGKIHFGVLQDEAAVDAITADDFVRKETDPPVDITKRPRNDTFNRVVVGFINRDKRYELDYEDAEDAVDQRRWGVREKMVKLVGIHNSAQAKEIAYRLLIDSMYRFNIYAFKLSFNKLLLDKFDVVTLSDDDLLSGVRVRIMNISEDVNCRDRVITAMDDLAIHYPNITGYDGQENLHTPDAIVTLANASVSFREDALSNKIFLSIVPADENFNGAYIYLSYDDVTYLIVGLSGADGVTSGDANSAGTMSEFLPDHPAVTWAKDETMLVNIGTVTDLRTDITDDEFWNDRYLVKIDEEIIAYKDAEEMATEGIWRITNLRRGLFGTDPVAHYSGEAFYTLYPDFSYTYSPADIGKTLYFKVVVYYGDEFQEISDLNGSGITVQGYYYRPAAASLLRLTADENDGGGIEYSGASFTLYWNLGSRASGYGIAGFDVNPAHTSWFYPDAETLLINSGGVLYDNYIQDTELQAVVLKFEQEDGTAIGEREIAVGESVTITKATDLGGYNPARIKVIPRRAMYAWDENSITVDDGT